jgi:hypothetical protein
MPTLSISKLSCLFLSATFFAALSATGSATASPTEVLYVAERGTETISLLTYNVNPETAVAQQVGSIFVGANNIDPLSVGNQHYLYIWDGTDVWLYRTNAKGAPAAQPAQHLTFDFGLPVYSFVVDPHGKFAYAAILYTDAHGNSDAAITLFTIDPSTGALTDTKEVVATYSNFYTYLTSFSFGLQGSPLFARYFDNGPYTCIPGYDYYRVSQSTGALGPLTNLAEVSADCGGTAGITVNDQLIGAESACCGTGSGYIQITQISTSQQIFCQASNLTFCGDDAGDLAFDPASQNIVFPDTDADTTYIGHIDFAGSQLVQSPSTLPGTPNIYFSPDSRVLFALYAKTIEINAFQSTTGEILAATSLPVQGVPPVTLNGTPQDLAIVTLNQ